MPSQLTNVVQEHREQIIAFCQLLIQQPSLSGHEQSTADLVAAEMLALGYDTVQVDEVGNVVGTIACGGGTSTMLTAHMDVIDPGEHGLWRFPPFSGTLTEDHLWGRGAVDDKACLAAMVYGAGLVRKAGIVPPGPMIVAATAGEEVGGYGAKYLATYLHPDLAIIGEPSGNTLRRGHRGKFEIVVTYHGRSVHASAPKTGLNPNFSLARFLLALRELPLASDPIYGGTSVAPTLLYVDKKASNVIPAAATVHLDWRNAPGETLVSALGQVRTLAQRCAEKEIGVTVSVPAHEEISYTGSRHELDASFGSFDMAGDDPRVLRAKSLLESELGRVMPVSVWGFCTDGGHLAQAGIPCLGFGPGNERMAHVLDECVAIDELVEGALAYAVLASGMGAI
ncbi:MAG: M20 family metallopeptidase [Anaerolineae bacterium]